MVPKYYRMMQMVQSSHCKEEALVGRKKHVHMLLMMAESPSQARELVFMLLPSTALATPRQLVYSSQSVLD